jgi:hypothetical protein
MSRSTSRYASGSLLPNALFFNHWFVSYVSKMDSVMRQYRERVEWMTTGSRRAVGAMLHARVCLVVNLTQVDGRNVTVYKQVLDRLVDEQIAGLESFNMIMSVFPHFVLPCLTMPDAACTTVSAGELQCALYPRRP